MADNTKTKEFDNLNNKSSGHGGAREGAGRPEGSINIKTKEKKEAEDYFKQRIIDSIAEIVNSQMNLAKGCQFLFKIETYKYKDKNNKWQEGKKKPKLVESQREIEEYLAGDYDDNEDDDYYFMTTQKPDNRALDSLVNRVFGKAVNKTELTGKDGEKLEVIAGFNYLKPDENNSPDNSPAAKTTPSVE